MIPQELLPILGEGSENDFEEKNLWGRKMQQSSSLEVSNYVRLSDVEHVLHRPDMYIGPIDRVERTARCFLPGDKKIVQKPVFHAEGEEQTFLEILGNSADNIQLSRDNGMEPGVIEIVVTDTWVVIRNYGMNIPIDKNEQGIWIPEFIFGFLRTSTKFDDTKKRLFIGKNGLGAKATNIFSKVFTIECADMGRQKLYKQTWNNNMTIKSTPEISNYTGVGYTQISYSLDFARFGVTNYDQEAIEIYGAHAAVVAFTCNIPVIFNGTTLEIPDIVDYAKLCFPITKLSAITYKDPDGVYEICLVDTPEDAICVSFVNGLITNQGGVHVDAAYKVMVDAIKSYLGPALQGITLTKKDIVNHVSLFLNCRVPNPQFKSQTKDCLSRPKITIKLPATALEGIKKWQLLEQIYLEIQRKQLTKLKKTDGKKRSRVTVDNFEDAGFAGSKRSKDATLIAVEGISASAYPVKFISQIPDNQGREHFGILPLHGKLLNVINAGFLQYVDNEDFKNIKKVLGLEEQMDYSDQENFNHLRYGNVLYIPDADNDGKHIMGLFLLYFMAKYPSLIQLGYIKFLRTPVIRVSHGGHRIVFYTYQAYNKWRKSLEDCGQEPDKWHHDYFKGLGSSEDQHIIEDYNSPKIVTFKMDEKSSERLLLAFHREARHLRKEWIANFVNREVLDVETFDQLPITIFLDHEFIEYSIENIIRAIPEAMDSIKESQRKVLYAAFKKLRGKKLDKIKVAQVGSHAAEITCYKHGEACLSDTIVTMAYNFVGVNNMPYFTARGQFGTRNRGGDDAAACRYTSISLPWWIDYIYRKEDQVIEKRIEDEGDKRECENFFPILHMGLVNGANGIGSGWSTRIPLHNPLDVALWLQQRLMGQPVPKLLPWYKNFLGQIVMDDEYTFRTEGKMKELPKDELLIEELPIGKSMHGYKTELEKMEAEGVISTFKNLCTHDKVKFIVKGYKSGAPTLKKLKLITKFSYRNMTVLYRKADRSVLPKIYDTTHDLLQDFYKIRLAKYQERKDLQLQDILNDIQKLSNRAAFIAAVNSKKLIIIDRRQEAIYHDIDTLGLDRELLNKIRSSEYSDEKVVELQNKIKKREEDRQNLDSTPCENIWYSELEEFIIEYCKREGVTRSTK